MKNLQEMIEIKGIHITEEGLIHLSYATGDEGILFHVSMNVNVDGDTTTFGAEDFKIISKDIRKKYSPLEILEFIKADLKGYGKLLSRLVLTVASIEEKIGEKVECIDFLNGIQKFYDMDGNSIATGTDVFNKEEFAMYKMLEGLFMPL